MSKAYDIDREARNLARRVERLWKARPYSAQAVREALTVELARANVAGYTDAHEFQMNARIRDAQECHEKNGRHL